MAPSQANETHTQASEVRPPQTPGTSRCQANPSAGAPAPPESRRRRVPLVGWGPSREQEPLRHPLRNPLRICCLGEIPNSSRLSRGAAAPGRPLLPHAGCGARAGGLPGRGAEGRRPARSSSGGADAQRLRGGTWPGLRPSAHLGRSPEAAAGGGRPRAGGGPASRGLAGEAPSTASARSPRPAGAGSPCPSSPAFVSRVSRSSPGHQGKKAPSP